MFTLTRAAAQQIQLAATASAAQDLALRIAARQAADRRHAGREGAARRGGNRRVAAPHSTVGGSVDAVLARLVRAHPRRARPMHFNFQVQVWARTVYLMQSSPAMAMEYLHRSSGAIYQRERKVWR